jgi:4-carboxymuconolactone decarboxylase
MSMRVRLSLFLLSVVSVAALNGQSGLPADVHQQSLSRLPPVQRTDLTDDEKRIWDLVAGPGGSLPSTGPAPISMYSPKVAEPMHMLNQYLRTSVVGSRFFELSALVAAREFDQQYEWSGHEPAARRAGLEQAVIDIVKFNREVAGVSDKDATVIRLGRALFRDHKVSPALWAKTVEHFGRRGAVEIAAIMGDYALAAVILTAADQQLPANRTPLLPPR